MKSASDVAHSIFEPVSTLDMSASSTAISFHVDSRASATIGCRQVATRLVQGLEVRLVVCRVNSPATDSWPSSYYCGSAILHRRSMNPDCR